MRVPLVKLGSLLLLCARPFAPVSAFGLEDFRVQRPDFCQVDDRYGELPGGGYYHCTPTSVANHLYELAKEFPNLISSKEQSLKDLVEIIRILSSKDYMNCVDGTYTENMMKGLEKYVKERGYNISIKYAGPRDIEGYSCDKKVTTEWIKKELKDGSNLILNADYYKNGENDSSEFIGSHCVTIVGFNDDKGFKLYIHDPAKRSGIEPQTETCDLVFSPDSRLEIKGIKLKSRSDIAFIGEIVAFKIEHPKGR